MNPGRFMNWWQRSRHVPGVLKSRQGLKDAAAWLLRLPFRFVGAVGRGLVVSLRAWRRWVRVVDYREAAENAEKLADKFVEIRALTLFRWKVTAVVVAGVAILGVLTDLVYGSRRDVWRLGSGETAAVRGRSEVSGGEQRWNGPSGACRGMNQAQAERVAARTEIERAPTSEGASRAEIYTMIDSLGNVGAVIKDARPAGLARLYQKLDLQMATK